ncbi:diguanylate cyclase [Dethiothermospora halolimnae]|uniref:diguanylate cyclase n=1 Tax=Dethiothermospora halolimnae TaxID=3114390 RepID=UPI003CCC14C3
MTIRGKIQEKLSKEVFIQVDLKGEIVDISENCYRILGCKGEEIIGKNIEEVFDNKDLRETSNTGGFVERDLIIKNKENNNTYMRVTKKVIKENDNETIYLSMMDVTEYKKDYNKFKRLMGILERANDIISCVNVEGDYKFDYVSPSVYDNLGITADECKENPMIPLEIVHPDNYEEHLKKYTGKIDYNQHFHTRFRHKNGKYLWFEEYITPVYNNEGKLIYIESIARNIQARKELEERLIHLSYHDSLTGIYNRTYFDKIREELDKSKDKPVALIICDLDNLKIINDKKGHEEGDKLIKNASDILKSNLNDDILLARIGGDEFAVILEDIDCESVKKIVENIKKTIKNYNKINTKLPIGMSIGYHYNKHSVGYMSEIFKRADRYMYRDKYINKSRRSYSYH